MKRKSIIKIINIVLIAIFAFSAFNLAKIYYDYGKANSTYQEIQSQYLTENNQSSQDKITEPSIFVDFPALQAKNSDIVGWLYSPDTFVNYPVVKGKDNDWYLHRNLDNKYLASGTLFADCRNSVIGQDNNFIIYGHNMKNGTMFGSLKRYKNQTYYDEHPVMYFLTPDKKYKIELLAGLVVKRDDKIYSINENREAFFELVKEYKTKSTFVSNTVPSLEDTFITLSTCSYEFDNARYIVIGRLITEK